MGSKLTETGVTFGSNLVEQIKPLRKVDGVEPDSQGNIEVPLSDDLENRVTILEDIIDPNQEKIYNVFQNRVIITSTYMRENLNGDVTEENSWDDVGIWSMTLPFRSRILSDPAYNKPYYVKIQATGLASSKKYQSGGLASGWTEQQADALLAGGGTIVWWGLVPPETTIQIKMMKNTFAGKTGYNYNHYVRPTEVRLYKTGFESWLKGENGWEVQMGYVGTWHPSTSGQLGGRTGHSLNLDPDDSSNGDGISSPKGLKIKSFWGYSPNGPSTIQDGDLNVGLYNGQIWGNAWNYFDPSTWYANMDVLSSWNYLDFPNPSHVSDGYGKVPINSGVPGDDRHSPPNGEGVVVIEWTPIGE